MTSCKEIESERTQKKTKFRVEIDIEPECPELPRKKIAAHLRKGQNDLSWCYWMKQLADIIEKG